MSQLCFHLSCLLELFKTISKVVWCSLSHSLVNQLARISDRLQILVVTQLSLWSVSKTDQYSVLLSVKQMLHFCLCFFSNESNLVLELTESHDYLLNHHKRLPFTFWFRIWTSVWSHWRDQGKVFLGVFQVKFQEIELVHSLGPHINSKTHTQYLSAISKCFHVVFHVFLISSFLSSLRDPKGREESKELQETEALWERGWVREGETDVCYQS